jgi:RNA polymerase sigma-70 factor (ECF subfamily)
MAILSVSSDNMLDAQSEFVQLLTAAQPRLYSYISTLLGNVHDASNVLQETNVALWAKSSEFEIGSNFLAWSREVAYYKALSYVRDRKRDRLIVNHALVEQIFARHESRDEDERRIALRHCLSQLDPRQRDLLRRRYTDGDSMDQLARHQNRSVAAVKMALKRVRTFLLGCINRRIALSQ